MQKIPIHGINNVICLRKKSNQILYLNFCGETVAVGDFKSTASLLLHWSSGDQVHFLKLMKVSKQTKPRNGAKDHTYTCFFLFESEIPTVYEYDYFEHCFYLSVRNQIVQRE